MPIRKGDGTGLALPGFQEVRTGDGRILYTATSTSLTTQMETAIHDDTNAHRTSQGLAEFGYRDEVADVARAHSQDMHDRDFFDHTNPDGEGPGDRLDAAGVSYTNWAENIAYQSGATVDESNVDSIAQDIVQGWIDSAGHRDNIESNNDSEGIGVFINGGEVWATQLITSP